MKILHLGEKAISKFEMNKLREHLQAEYARPIVPLEIVHIEVEEEDDESFTGYHELEEIIEKEISNVSTVILPASKMFWLPRLASFGPALAAKALIPCWTMIRDGGGEAYLTFHGYLCLSPEYRNINRAGTLVDSSKMIEKRGGKFWYDDPSNFPK